MITFILGGVKGGKSMFAQYLSKYLAAENPLYYFATMIPGDKEDEKRIMRHRYDRENWGYTTVEEGFSVAKGLKNCKDNSTVLFDSVTAYVQNNMFCLDKPASVEDMISDIQSFKTDCANAVIVSDYIFSDAIEYAPSVTEYLRALGKVHIETAAFADLVLECTFSNIRILKNSLDFDISFIKQEYYKSEKHLMYSDI